MDLSKTYSELITFKSYNERLRYLQLLDNNADSPRHISGEFYHSKLWKDIRKRIIKRDLRFDLGIFGIYIEGKVYVHHINPISEYDILNMTDKLISSENLITMSLDTHNIIHYGKEKEIYIERKPGDTILW